MINNCLNLKNGRCRGKFDLSLSFVYPSFFLCFLVKFSLFSLPLQLEDKLYPLWRLSTLSLRLPRFTVHSRVTELTFYRGYFIASTRWNFDTLLLFFSLLLHPSYFLPQRTPSKP